MLLSWKKPKALPWITLVPLLMTALTTAPVVRPYSASYCPVRTWNSWTASIGVRACMPARWPMTSSLLLPPSTV